MKILVLGGTGFVGRHLVAAALERGHEITLFNRGSDRHVFPDVERRIGDRDGGLAALDGGAWDWVLDVNGYVPRLVRDAAERLEGRVGRYAFVSTISVYARPSTPVPLREGAPLASLDDPTTEVVDGATYGGLKVLCEHAVDEVFGERALHLRPGIVAGPFDPTDRFTYWVRRMAQGGEVLGPHAPDAPTQWIDGRDLAEFGVEAMGRERSGAYNLVRPSGSVAFGDLLSTAARVSGSDASVTWVPAPFLEKQGVRPGADLPLFHPAALTGIGRVDPSRAVADGLRARPLEETVRDTLEWDRTRAGEALEVGLSRERERELLEAWRSRSGAA
jgi:2'-hydroxyisoflavone reductase